ncbi:MAG: hypothetical protein U9R26_08950 [Campylobacterota bacterium]|nr:hypothetical protein [Campylobacterota bacterium]
MNKLFIGLFLLAIGYGLYNAKQKESVSCTKCSKEDKLPIDQTDKLAHLQNELSNIHTAAYLKEYIVTVINHGSSELGFKGGVMEGGYVSHEDAPKIACYVLEMSGKRCSERYPEDAAMFYTSVCGGCHGNDGKGLGGTYPDLTRKTMLGIEKREESLRKQITKSTSI